MTESQVVAIVDHDQLREIALPSTSQQATTFSTPSDDCKLQGWKVRLPKLQKNHLTGMMIICLAISCFITVFSLLMIIVPFISELSKYQQMAKERLGWSDRNSYETLESRNENLRSRRSTEEIINSTEIQSIRDDLERYKRDEPCFNKVKDLSYRLTNLLDKPILYSFQIRETNRQIREAYDRCISGNNRDSMPFGLSNLARLAANGLIKLTQSDNERRSVDPKSFSVDQTDPVVQEENSVRYGWEKITDNIPPTGPEGISPGEAIKTSQQLTVSLPQVMQQTCILKPSQQQFPPAPPTYICYPSDGFQKQSMARQEQSIHVPTAIASPNPYYFPTVAGSPVINSVFESKPSFNPSTGTIQLPNPASQGSIFQFQQAPVIRPIFHHQAPQFHTIQYQPNPINPHPPVLHVQSNPYNVPQQPVYQTISLQPGSQIHIQCSYHPAPGSPYKTFSFPPVLGVSENSRHSGFKSSATNYSISQKHAVRSNCDDDGISCGDDAQTCVPASSFCDSKVDCPNGQDEINCSCNQRIDPYKRCDAFPDCPDSEDETNCHGCGPGWFSCYDMDNSKPTCLPLEAKCDGVHQCPNGKDEIDCVLLFENLQNDRKLYVSYNQGYLHRNWRGVWYPACVEPNSIDLARQACQAEQGYSHYRMPLVAFPKLKKRYDGPFIRIGRSGITLIRNCYGDKAVYVRCPTIHCGRQHHHGTLLRNIRKLKRMMPNVFERNTLEVSINTTRFSRGQDGRVVGGWKSEPGRWPWVVAIYRDGLFHCGGAIIDTRHILTAAHCFTMYNNHYYEVHAGILRRLSFSPQRQIRRVETVFIHENYNAKTMQNDLSIIKLDKDLKLNRWVGVVCIPPLDATFPRAGDIATAVGWGATHEHGPDPDSMHEVEVPIMSACKRQVDRDAEEICAGAIEGGRDTCQGDSGGPLLCRPYTAMSPEWYVCGIVSHGEGCARPDEPGAYTRVSIFSNWIAKVVRGTKEGVQPLKYCPGRECSDGRCIDQDRICDGTIDCLRGEDEIDCPNSEESSQDDNTEIFNEIVPILRESDIISNNISNNLSSAKSSIYKNDDNHHLTTDINSDNLTTSQISSNKSNFKTESESTLINNTKSELGISDSIHTAINSSSFETQNTTPKIMPAYILQEAVENTFICSKYKQQIKREYRCDGVIDCEDSSDEIGCTCKDRLQQLNPDLICNSEVDCKDRTDEENCTSRCPEGYVFLPHSKICISELIRCNYKAELPDQEDEEGCYSLVPNITNVQFDENGLIIPSIRGLLVHPDSANPRPVCLPLKDFNDLNKKAIQFLGFGAWEWFLPVQLPEVGIDTCLGIYGVAKNYAKFGKKAPWLASISVDGNPSGSGVLIHPLWVLTSLRFSSQNALLLNKSFISCTLGFLNLAAGPAPVGAFEVSSKVDKAVVIPKHGLVLLRLKNPIKSSSVVKPLMILDDLKQGARDKCFAVGLEYNSRVHVLNATRVDCSGNRTCYTITPIKDNSQDDILDVQVSQHQNFVKNSDGQWSGGIWCKDENDKPYLDCIFDSRDMCSGPCSLKCTPVLANYPLLDNITDKYEPEEYKLYEFESAMEQNLDRIKRMNEMTFNYPVKKVYDDYFDNNYDYIESGNLGTNYYPSNQDQDFYGDINKSYDNILPEYGTRDKRSIKSTVNGKIKDIYSNEMNINDNLVDESFDISKQYDHSSNTIGSEHHEPSSYLNDYNHNIQEQAKRGRANSVIKSKFENNSMSKKDKKSVTYDDLVIDIDLGQEAECNGVRCSKGDCIPWSKVNDGFPDCSEGLDEAASINRTEHCLTHPNDCFGCRRDELSCGDNTCIPTHKFCDGIHDCSTMIDEPESCSTNCSSFLMLKHPSLLCDGNPHCVDGSDESWSTCGPETACNQTNSFKCNDSSGCIPKYQVCDGYKNCPLGDDEQFCAAIKSHPKRLWEGLLTVRLLGEWMPRCLNSHIPVEELEKVCKLLGWKGGLKSADYTTRSAMIPTFETYSTFNLNSKTKYSIVYDRSSITMKTIEDCLSLYITCQ